MTKKKFDIVATVEYADKDGEKRKRYINCGAAFEKEGRISLKLEAVPVDPGWNGWLSLYEPRGGDRSERREPQPTSSRPSARRPVQDDDSDIPFR